MQIVIPFKSILKRTNVDSGFTISQFQVDAKNKLMVLERNALMKNAESTIFLMLFHEVCDI